MSIRSLVDVTTKVVTKATDDCRARVLESAKKVTSTANALLRPSVVGSTPAFPAFAPVRNSQMTLDGTRSPERKYDMIVLHYPLEATATDAVNTLRNNGDSVHFVIDRDTNATIYATVDEALVAGHAQLATPHYDDKVNEMIKPNKRSFGIEVVNLGNALPRELRKKLSDSKLEEARKKSIEDEKKKRLRVGTDYWQVYTDAQYRSIAQVIRYLCGKYGIPPQYSQLRSSPFVAAVAPLPDAVHDDQRWLNYMASFRGVVGHQELTWQKQDPGPAFDWERLMKSIEPLNWPFPGSLAAP